VENKEEEAKQNRIRKRRRRSRIKGSESSVFSLPFFFIKENVRTKCPDLEVLCEYFENLSSDPRREEGGGYVDVKILKK